MHDQFLSNALLYIYKELVWVSQVSLGPSLDLLQ